MNSRAKDSKMHRSVLLWFERISMTCGLLLLVTFAIFKFQQNESSSEGLTAFYQQLQASSLVGSGEVIAGEPAAISSQPAAVSDAVPNKPPEFELWSDLRIREHKESLLQEADPPLGVLRIERLNIEVAVYNGTDDFLLNRGVGRIIGTAPIDGNGNLGIAGHRDGFFRGLKDIKPGDVLELQTIHGAVQYRVGSTVIVDPSDVSVLVPTTEQTLTLVTCYPFYFVGHAPKRFIVQATAQPHIAMN